MQLFFLLLVTSSLKAQTLGIWNEQPAGDLIIGNSATAVEVMRLTANGMLIPQLSTTERDAIVSPANALFIFNTTVNCFQVYNTSAVVWENFYCFTGMAGCDNPPAAPTAATHTPSETQIIWNWNSVGGATGYKYNIANNYSTATDNGASITHTQTGLTCNTAYTLYVWAYSICGNSSVTSLTQTTSACFICGTSTVNDIDGNTYNTVLIGSQCWLKENMRTTKYPGGGAITKGPASPGGGWTVDLSYYSCPPNTANTAEDCAAATSLGLVYQWSAAMDGSTTAGAQGVCPTGWHIPTDIEWKALEGQLGMSVAQQDLTDSWRGTNEGSEMANDVADQTWTTGTLTGGSGFGDANGLNLGPSGYRSTNGNYFFRSNNEHLWSSTESGSDAWRRYLNDTFSQVYRSTLTKAYGFSVRCVKD